MIKEILPLTKLKLEVLTELYIHSELNLSTIAKNINQEIPNVTRILKELDAVIEKKKMGKIILYKLIEENNNYIKPIIEQFRLEKALEIDTKIIKLIISGLNIKEMYLFGSYVKNTQNENSDIDIILISDENKAKIKEKINNISKLTNKKIEIQHFTSKEYENILKDKNSTFNAIINDKTQRISINI